MTQSFAFKINCIQRFCETVGMSLNLLKTKIIVFRIGRIVKEIKHWFYQGEHIHIVSSHKYVGVYFTPKLIWTKTKEVLACQASKAVKKKIHLAISHRKIFSNCLMQ